MKRTYACCSFVAQTFQFVTLKRWVFREISSSSSDYYTNVQSENNHLERKELHNVRKQRGSY